MFWYLLWKFLFWKLPSNPLDKSLSVFHFALQEALIILLSVPSAVATSVATTILFFHWGDWREAWLISPPIPDSDVRPQGLTAVTPVLGTEHPCIPTYKCQWRLLHCTPAEVLATLLLIHSHPRLTATFRKSPSNVLVLS